MKVLVADDDRAIRQSLTTALELNGYQVTACKDGVEALAAFRSDRPDVLVLDVMMPGVDGLGVCRVLRAEGDRTPILMLTARADEVDKLVGFKLGADDYMTKPFSPRELDARIEALLRRQRSTGPAQANRREIGAITIDVAAREVAVDGVPVELTRIEFELLNMFTGSPKVVFSRQQLLDRVWGPDWYADDHVVDVHIANLRKKVDREGEPSVIRTVRGVGYGFRG